jgi:ABC-type glycerol-3-phosphate transport system permease component
MSIGLPSIILFVALGVIPGYWALRTKSYRGIWNLLLILSLTPLFWILVACLKNRNDQISSKNINLICLSWAFFNFIIILALK